MRNEAFLVLLGEVTGERHLPILVGTREAQAIALALEEETMTRPMPHDLLSTTLMSLGYTIDEILITDLKDDIFFSKMVLSNGQNTITVDARPSDAIAVGLRFKADIWIDTALLDTLPVLEQKGPLLIARPPQPTPKAITECSIGTLEKLLKKAVKMEEYERAALVRDELKRRTKQ
ncbi:MAG: bifunctional nuclease family protein [Bacteroidota bacterium]